MSFNMTAYMIFFPARYVCCLNFYDGRREGLAKRQENFRRNCFLSPVQCLLPIENKNLRRFRG
uniref:ATE_N domain-containing protein n=1 Tax=Syphacia muris TaxID=451379 RepID=A0A0N5APR0_9BILA